MQTAVCENQPSQVSQPRALQLKHDIEDVLDSPSFTLVDRGQVFHVQYLTSAVWIVFLNIESRKRVWLLQEVSMSSYYSSNGPLSVFEGSHFVEDQGKRLSKCHIA